MYSCYNPLFMRNKPLWLQAHWNLRIIIFESTTGPFQWWLQILRVIVAVWRVAQKEGCQSVNTWEHVCLDFHRTSLDSLAMIPPGKTICNILVHKVSPSLAQNRHWAHLLLHDGGRMDWQRVRAFKTFRFMAKVESDLPHTSLWKEWRTAFDLGEQSH